MIVRVKDIVNSNEVMQQLGSTSFKGKTAFQIARLLKCIDEEMTTFQDTRVQLIRKYAEIDENGELKIDENGNCNIRKDAIKQFNDEINELLNTEIEINANPIKIEDLDESLFSPRALMQIEAFIE